MSTKIPASFTKNNNVKSSEKHWTKQMLKKSVVFLNPLPTLSNKSKIYYIILCVWFELSSMKKAFGIRDRLKKDPFVCLYIFCPFVKITISSLSILLLLKSFLCLRNQMEHLLCAFLLVLFICPLSFCCFRLWISMFLSISFIS